MVPSLLITVLQGGTAFAGGLTAFRLLQTGLQRRYPVLFCYMAFISIYQTAPLVMDTTRRVYFWTWVYCQPVQWILDVLVVGEMCHVILEKHPGLATLGRWGMYAGVIISAFLSYLTLLPNIHSSMPARSRLVAYWVATGRGVTFGLAVLLILILFWLSRYPVHLSKNVVLNAVLFTVVFLCDSLQAILRTAFDLKLNPWLIAALTGMEVAWLLLWFFRLKPEGEQTQFSWIRFGPEYEKRVLRRLDAINGIITGRVVMNPRP